MEGVAIAKNNLGWLYTIRGELDAAEQLLFEALDLSRQIGYSSLMREAHTKIGELHIARQQWEEAIEVLVEVVPALEELGANDQLLHVYRLLGEAALAKNDLDQVSHWLSKLDVVIGDYTASKTELPALQNGEICRFRGMVAVRLQEWEHADRHLQESVVVFRQLRSRLYLGRTVYQQGLKELAQNQPTAASEYFVEAVEIFETIGASLDLKRVNTARQAL